MDGVWVLQSSERGFSNTSPNFIVFSITSSNFLVIGLKVSN